MKNIKNRIKTIALSSVIISSLSFPIYADTNDIGVKPVFTLEDGIWYPGHELSKPFVIYNNKSKNIRVNKIKLDIDRIYDEYGFALTSEEFKQVLQHSKVVLKYKDKELYNGSLYTLVEKGVVISPSIKVYRNSEKTLDMSISMDEKYITNASQGLTGEFNIAISYNYESSGGGIIDPEEPDTEGPENPDIENPNIEKPDTDVDGEELPQTGGMINSYTLTGLGLLAAGVGIALDRKSSEKGGKKDE